jgi:hypothetical protein
MKQKERIKKRTKREGEGKLRSEIVRKECRLVIFKAISINY